MSKGDGEKITIKFDRKLTNSIDDSLKAGLTITGKEFQHFNGPLISKNYEIGSASLHPSYPIGDHILLEVAAFNRFRNVEGNLTVTYDSSIGDLLGAGGLVESFTESFLPLDLLPLPNPYQAEQLEVGITPTMDVTQVYHTPTYEEENLTATFNGITFLVTKVGTNPL